MATLGPSAVSDTVTGLSGGTHYTFTVKAENAAGTSPASNTVEVTTTTSAPSAPTGLHETAKTHTSVSLAWTAPAATGGARSPTTWSARQAPLVATWGPSTRTDTVTGLSGSTTYHFSVEAENAVGDSSASGTLAVTTTATVPPPGHHLPRPTSTSGYDLVGSDGGVFVFPPGASGGFYGSLPGLGVSRATTSWAWCPPPTTRATSWSAPTAGCSPSATPRSWAPCPASGSPRPSPSPASCRPTQTRATSWSGRDGGVFAFGTRPFLGRCPGRGSVSTTSSASPPPPRATATGWWPATGTVYAFGAAKQLGIGHRDHLAGLGHRRHPHRRRVLDRHPERGGLRLRQRQATSGSLPGLGVTPALPVIGIVHTAGTGGYWLIGSDGGIFAFGNAAFVGSLPGLGVRDRHRGGGADERVGVRRRADASGQGARSGRGTVGRTRRSFGGRRPSIRRNGCTELGEAGYRSFVAGRDRDRGQEANRKGAITSLAPVISGPRLD